MERPTRLPRAPLSRLTCGYVVVTRTCLSLSARHLDGGTAQAAAGNGFTNSELGKPLAHGAAVEAILDDEEIFDE